MRKVTHPEVDGELQRFAFEFHHDETLDADPCPHCGHEGFFNISWGMNGQVAQTNADGNGEYGLDDAHAVDLTYLECGHCREALVERDDWPNLKPVRHPDELEFDIEWRSVQRSTPAEHCQLVPDDALDYEVYVTDDLSLTIYCTDVPEQYWLVGTAWEDQTLIGEYDEYHEAREAMQRQKTTLAFAR